MEKNTFLIYNDLVYEMHTCNTLEDIKTLFLPHLKMLIPYSYASILLTDPKSTKNELFCMDPICVPESFKEAEINYIAHQEEDPVAWLMHGTESNLIRESDILEESTRLSSPLYLHCYKNFNVYDTMQYSIVYKEVFLGVITLFRTRVDGTFTEDDMFFFRSIGIHLNRILYQLLHTTSARTGRSDAERIRQLCLEYDLTAKESQVLTLIYDYKSNPEIAEDLHIQETTLLKHIQNIFRKMNVSSKWELLKLL